MRNLLGLAPMILLASASLACGAPASKLPAPALSCTSGEGAVQVAWAAVEGAEAYDVHATCVLPDGRETDFAREITEDTSASFDAEGCVSVEARVRALPGADGDDHPVQGAGPKGHWADCEVTFGETPAS